MAAGAGNIVAQCDGRARRWQSGFTLIEILVTVAIFSLAVTVLASGLRSGARAYKGVLAHQKNRAQDEQTIARIREDFRHLCAVSEEAPALTETAESAGGERLHFTALSSLTQQRAGLGAVWREVEYRIGEDNEGATGLLREEQAFVAAALPLGEPVPPQLLVPGASSVEFAYMSNGDVSAQWTDPEGLPAALIITVTRDGAPPLKATMWVPGAMRGAAS